MKFLRIQRRHIAAVAVTAAAAFAPFSFTPEAGATVNDACADGACCMEIGSFCGTFVDNYTSLSGECGPRYPLLRPSSQTTDTSSDGE